MTLVVRKEAEKLKECYGSRLSWISVRSLALYIGTASRIVCDEEKSVW
jgi:hypothetical protein